MRSYLKRQGIQTVGHGIKEKPLILKFLELHGIPRTQDKPIKQLLDLYLAGHPCMLEKPETKATKRRSVAKKYSSNLKKRATKAENRFRNKLNQLKIKYKFQHIIPNTHTFYIIDFYIPNERLCIELDGGYHEDPIQQRRDRKRDKFLVSKEYKVWRLTNEEADQISLEEISSKITSCKGV